LPTSAFSTLALVYTSMPRFLKAFSDAALLEGLLDHRRAVLVLERQHAIDRLDHGDLAAVRVEHVGELHPDRAGPDHGERGRSLGLHERTGRADHALLVDLQEGQIPRPRSGGEDDVLGGVARLLAFRVDLDLPLAREPPVTLDVRDLVFLEQAADAPVHLLGDLAAALLRGTEVEGQALSLDAVLLGGLHLVHERGARQQRLGRDAADVQADAAELVHLYTGRLQAELGRPNGGDVSARSAADDHHVEAGLIRFRGQCYLRAKEGSPSPPRCSW
jgi:hypothetical protein